MSQKQKEKNVLYLKSKKGTRKTFFQKLLNLKIGKKIFIAITLILLSAFGIFYAFIYPELYSLHEIYVANPENRLSEIGPKDPIEIKFSRAIKKDKLEKGFSINPDVKGEITWKDELSLGYAQTFIFTPKEYFEPDKIYRISLSELESFYGTRKKEAQYSFKTINSPKIKKISPEKEEIEKKLKPEIEITTDKESSFFNFTFELSPERDIEINYDYEKAKYKIKPKEDLSLGTEYKLKVNKYFNPESPVLDQNNVSKKDGKIIDTFEYDFKTVPEITIEDIYPEEGSKKNSQFGEVRISFNRAVDYEMAESNFSIMPQAEGEIGWEEKTLVFEPKKLDPNTEYKIAIKKGIKAHEDEGYLREDYNFDFKTEINPKEVIPNVPIEPQITEGKYIDIDISEQILTIFENGKSLGSYLISTGKYGMPTPFGKFRILSKSEVAYSSKYNLYMPFWMQFTSAGHGIHELPFWKYRGGAEYKERESHLGTRISHGCVRLGVGPAERVYKWAEIGTPVVVHE